MSKLGGVAQKKSAVTKARLDAKKTTKKGRPDDSEEEGEAYVLQYLILQVLTTA